MHPRVHRLRRRQLTRVYRILRKPYSKKPLDGEGAYQFGGRWSSPGTRLAYAAEYLSLAMIEEDYGPSVALNVARELVVYLKRSGGQEQYSEPLQFQTHAADRFAELVSWMTNNPTAEMTVEKLARRLGCEPGLGVSAGERFLQMLDQHTSRTRELFLQVLERERAVPA